MSRLIKKTKEHEEFLLENMPQTTMLSTWISKIGNYNFPDYQHYINGGVTAPQIVTKGTVLVKTAKGKTKLLKTGDMFCFMNDVFIEFSSEPDKPWGFCWLLLQGSTSDVFVKELGFTKDQPWLTPNDPEKTLQGFENILTLARTGNDNFCNIGYELLKLSNAIRTKKNLPITKSQQITMNAKTLINTQLHKGLNVEEIADQLNLSRSYLLKVFKKECNCSPIDYIRKQRINMACRTLEHSNHKITVVAKMCGFSDEKYFIKTFKNIKGVTPGKYRSNNKKS